MYVCFEKQNGTKIEMTELASPMEEATVLFTVAFLARGGNDSLGRMPAFKGMMDWMVELF